METKLSARAMPGQVWKVKTTPITRRYGVSVRVPHGFGDSKNDVKACPGEQGTIVEREWSGTYDNGEAWTNKGMWIVFSRGRETSVNCADLADFVLVKKS